jgi:cysteinyl-tRNA synthetase
MKKVYFLLVSFFFFSCGIDNSSDVSAENQINYRQEMRDFVKKISFYSKNKNPKFVIIPQNGIELITENGEPEGKIKEEYINAIDGVGQEDLFYGYEDDNKPTPKNISDYLNEFLQKVKRREKKVLVTDYCWDTEKIDDSYQKNHSLGYISIATCRELDCIPDYPQEPFNVNSENIDNLGKGKNFLYLINPDKFSSKEDFIQTLKNTNYDILIIDAFFDEELLSKEDINELKFKKNGGKRLVIAYMSIGEAEDYRYYWNEQWKVNPPEWLDEENPDWEGNYKVKYWMEDWKKIIYGNPNSYLDKILSSGFDGVYLDIIDAFEYFENRD